MKTIHLNIKNFALDVIDLFMFRLIPNQPIHSSSVLNVLINFHAHQRASSLIILLC